jgi:hypothetical protein
MHSSPRISSLGIRVSSLGIVIAALAGCSDTKGTTGQVQSAAIAVSGAPDADMIVIMRDQLTNVSSAKGALVTRAAAIASAHAPLLARLQNAKPRSAHSFELVNGFATKLSNEEVDALSANPDVLAVVPDGVVRLQKHAPGSADASAQTKATAAVPAADGLCDTLEPEALQATNTAFLDPTIPQAQTVLDGNGQLVTGQGVKVAILADGFDPNVPGLIRPDGTHVVVDFQDFWGDPAGTPNEAIEMFGDASSIAAQDTPNGTVLNYDISTFVNPAHPLPSPCNIRVRGMAPGASLVALRVFNAVGSAPNSVIVQAIDWAVVHENVDIINESFGGALVSDNGNDVISLANKAAVRAGVTVVTITGDAGSVASLDSPGSDPFVITAGASTTWRLDAQTNDGMYPLAKGYVSGNVSALSSGGFAQKAPRTPDLLAPGNWGWALCSANDAIYTGCVDFNGNGAPLQVFGGTSESAPLVAGAAALVIQAYRSTHGGATPPPALVKTILLSSTRDIGAPPQEQGTGLLDALAAVNTALSLKDDNGSPDGHGDGLLVSPTSASVTTTPGHSETGTFEITNTGAAPLALHPALEVLGAPSAGATLTINFDPSTAPTYVNVSGAKRAYTSQTFTVPAGVDHLDAAVAWRTQQGSVTLVAMLLVDPSGNQVAYSEPQGNGQGYAHADVVKPVAGQWTAFFRTNRPPSPVSYSGPLVFTWSVENFVSAGQVWPQSITLAPGGHAHVTAKLSAPSTPGDSAVALRLHDASSDRMYAEIPFALRTLVPVDSTGGVFTGRLTGNNGRAFEQATSTYAFDVPYGVTDLALGLQISDSGYQLVGNLVDPNGMVLAAESNLDPTGARQSALQLFRSNPAAGRWRFVLQELQASGKQPSIDFTARISFNAANISAPGLPTGGANLSVSGGTLSVPVSVTNTGALAKAYFADARVDALAEVTLPTGSCSTATTLPRFCATVAVPPRARKVRFAAQSSVPITMEETFFAGGPDLGARPSGDGVVGAILEPEVPYNTWFLQPLELGPFGSSGAPNADVTVTVTARMQPFDTAVRADTGNKWLDLAQGNTSYKPLVLAPGATGTINLTFTADASKIGTTVNGFVYVDTYNNNDFSQTGEEVFTLPYSYTITP